MPKGKTDLLILSDGIVHVPSTTEKSFLEWKAREKCRTIGIMIGVRDAGGMAKVLDEVHLSDRVLGTADQGVLSSLSI